LPESNQHPMHNPEWSKFSFAFSCLFYKKISERMMKSNDEEYIDMAGRWDKNVNLCKYKILFIPISGSMHWSLIVVINPYGIRKVRPPRL